MISQGVKVFNFEVSKLSFLNSTSRRDDLKLEGAIFGALWTYRQIKEELNTYPEEGSSVNPTSARHFRDRLEPVGLPALDLFVRGTVD